MSGWASPYRLTGMALPMAVWALHFVAVYSVQGVACAGGGAVRRVAGLESTSWWLLLLTLLALLAIGVLGWRAARAWRMHAGPQVPTSRDRFAAAATALLALLAAVAVAFTAVPILLLPPCA